MGVRQARAFDGAERFASSVPGAALMFLWSAGEATVCPVIADFLLLPLAAVAGRRFKIPLSAAIAGMAAGGIAGYLFALRFPRRNQQVLRRLPLTPAHKVPVARRYLRRYGLAAFLFQPYSGIPMKVWSAAAALLGLSPLRAIPVFVAARAIRMTLVAVTARLVAGRFHGAVRNQFVVLFTLYTATFFAVWGRMIGARPWNGED